MHTRQSPAKAGDCGYARPLASIKEKKMNQEAIYEILKPLILKEIKGEWKSAYFKIKLGESFSEYVGYSIDKDGKEEMFDPAQFDVNWEVLDKLKEIAFNSKEDKWNKLRLDIFPNETFKIETEWDIKQAKANEAFKEAMNKLNNPKSEYGNFTNKEFQLEAFKERFTENNESKTQLKRVVLLNILTPNIIGHLYSRLFTLFGNPREIMFEGFMYYLLDRKSQINFGIGLTQSGIGYFAEKKSKNLLEQLKEFDELLFSSNLKITDCQIEIKNDFGKMILGSINGVPFQKEEEFDFEEKNKN